VTEGNENSTPDMPGKPGFDALALSPATREALRDAGFETPLPVQWACFDPLRAGRDALIQAATGTGKTLAYALPMIDGLAAAPQGPTFLVLAPTRELANQVAGELERFGGKGGLKVALLYGGVSIEPQLAALRDGVHGIVGTPGRVLDIFDRVPKVLRALRVLVLDEADQLLSMGFEPDIEAVVQRFPGRYQGIFVSATLPPDIMRLAERFLRDPALISLSEDGQTPSEIRHQMFLIDPANRLRDLVRILEAERPESSFIFCNTRDDAQILSGNLRERGYAVDLLSGELSQHERDRVMNEVREGRVQHLVATDLAARGLDVLHLTHVIHYQFPQTPESYVHRSGRVGRVGQTGTAISLVGPQDVATLYMLRLTYGIRPLERHLPSDAEVAREREAELVRGLLARFAAAPVDPQALSLLRRLGTHVDGERVLAGVLHAHLEPEVLRDEARRADAERRRAAHREPPREARREPRREPPREPRPQPSREARPEPPREPRPAAPVAPAPPAAPPEASPPVQAGPVAEGGGVAGDTATAPDSEGHRRRRRRRRGPGDDAPPGAAPPPGAPLDGAEPAGTPSEEGESEERPRPEDLATSRSATGKELRTIFLNVGVADGVDGDFLGQWLQGRLALRASEFGPVKVRDRSTVVAIPVDRIADAVGALSGLRFGGRLVHAEEARRK
jgi:ATP-dependent RNA helicase DeaD